MASLINFPLAATSGFESERVRFRQHQQLAHFNQVPLSLFVLEQGWLVRYRLLADGRRQITAYYVPGDICGLSWMKGANAGQPVQAVCDVEAIELRCDEVASAAQASPLYLERLQRECALEAAIQSEHLVTLGRRTAAERLAQLFCEIHCRMDAAGQSINGECALPLTQLDLADVSGLTSIHVNRVLQEMRGAGMIELKGRRLKVLDFERLARLAMFDVRYLAGLALPRLRECINY